MKLKTLLIQVALWGVLAQGARAEQNLTNNLRNGLYEEEANHNLPVAIQNYQALISRFDEERKLAATAVFRLAECYRKLGQTNEANAQYQRVAREFFDQTNLAELSRVYLGLTNVPNAGPEGIGAASLDILADGQTYHPASEEEARELRHVITLTKDSPDLVNGLAAGGHDTTLQNAVQGNRLAVVQYLLDRGANVDAVVRDRQPMTPLALAASGGHKSMVELLLAHGANPNAHPYLSSTPLNEASRMGYNSVVEVLLAHGAEVNGKDSQGNTPLHKAVGYPKTMEILLGHGADPKLKNDAGQGPLLTAVDQNQFEAVKLLLQRHVDPNTTDMAGDTALRHALTSGFTELAELLLENGASVNAKDSKGMSELHHQVERVDLKAVEVLLSHGADATTKDANGQTLLHSLWRVALEQINTGHGARSSSLRIAEALIRAHLDVNGTNKGGYSVLSEVIRAANNPQFGNQILGWAKLLVENHADVNARDGEGNPPVNWLVYPGKGSKEALRLLLDHGADPNIPYIYTAPNARQIRGATPLHVARLRGKSDYVALLLAHGAVDRGGDTEPTAGTNALSVGMQTNGTGVAANPSPQFFFVGGEVEKPDRYPYVEGLTVTKAIVIAGGSKKGNMASVRLRRAKPGPDQKSEDIIVHVARALKDPSADYPVYPGDTVWVPEKVF